MKDEDVKELEKKVTCKACGKSKFTLEQLEKSKKLYKKRFDALKDKMSEMYERKEAENKAYLMRVFGAELARVRDSYIRNKQHTETLVKAQFASLQVLIKQELQLAGVESEFGLRRVS